MPFRGCTITSDCPTPGDNCLSKNMSCYADNGVVGASIALSGTPDPLGADLVANPTLVGLPCIIGTNYTALNDVAGLPGLARITVPVTLSDPTAP
jgi:hypothetical protein